MKIAFDTSPLYSGHNIRGMGFYTKNLKRSLKSLSADIDFFVFQDNKEELKKYDLIHYPYFDLFFTSLPSKFTTKAVVTVPDVIPLLYPKHYPPGTRGRVKFLLQRQRLVKANAIITLSETSKKDIVRFLGISQEKIFPIHLAPGNDVIDKKKTDEAVLKKYNLPQKYVLYIGDINYNKNVVRLAEACRRANIALVIIGKQAADTSYDKNHIENRELSELQDNYIRKGSVAALGFLESKEFSAVLQSASLYSQPSLYEGFGLPILEAQEIGVPVISAKTQALVEIAENSALFFDPLNVEDIKNKIENAMSNKALRRSLIKMGKLNADKYSWKKTAKETIDVYESILNK